MSDIPDEAVAERALRRRVTSALSTAFGGRGTSFETRAFGVGRTSGIIMTADYVPWAVEVLAAGLDMTNRAFQARLVPYMKLLAGGGAVGLIVVSEDGISKQIEDALPSLPINIHHYTVERLESGPPIDLEALAREFSHAGRVAGTDKNSPSRRKLPDDAAAERKLRHEMSILLPDSFGGGADFEVWKYKGGPPSGLLFKVGDIPWAAEVIVRARQMSERDFRAKLVPYEALLRERKVIGLILVSREGLSKKLQALLSSMPHNIRHYTLGRLMSGPAIDLHAPEPASPVLGAPSENRFEAEVLRALRSRFYDVEAQPRSGRDTVPDASFTTDSGGRWLVDIMGRGRNKTAAAMQALLSPYYRMVHDGRADGILVITKDGLSAPAQRTANRAPFPVRHCTLDELVEGNLGLGGSVDVEVEPAPGIVAIEGTPATATGYGYLVSDYPGRIVIIDRTSRNYRALMKDLEAVSTELRTSNSLTLRADVKDRLLVEVDSGRKLLSADTARPEAVKSVLAGPLKWLAEQASQATLRELAKRAFDGLIEMFKNPPGGGWL